MSVSTAAFSPDHLSSFDQLCYVQCNLCDTVLAVSVPCKFLFKTVTVRCGHCTTLLSGSMNMRGLLPPAPNQLHQLGHSLFSTQTLLEEMSNLPSNVTLNLPKSADQQVMPVRGAEDLPRPQNVNRPPEKRQRVPSAYNRFIKHEIQRIKARNPDISHREAFSAAAKNWAHFPHIHYGLIPDQHVNRPNTCQQDGENVLLKDDFFGPESTGVSPF